MKIEDGTGLGYQARVNSDNRLFTLAESLPGGVIAAAEKKLFTVATDVITLTNSGTSAIIHFKYAGVHRVIMPRITFTVEESAGAPGGDVVFEAYRNPVDGTLVTNAVPALVTNRNFAGTASQLIGNKFQGVQGDTTTGGTLFARPIFSAGSGLSTLDLSSEPLCLESGNSLAYTVTPPAGNTSLKVRIFAYFYELVLD